MVVAGDSDELLAVLGDHARTHELELGLMIPAEEDPDEAARLLRGTLARFRAAGLYVRDATLAQGDLATAAARAARTYRSEEIVLAAPGGRVGLGPLALREQIATAAGLPVEFVPAVRMTPSRVPAATAPPRPRRRPWRSGWRRRPRRVVAARALVAIGLALLGLAAVSAAVGDDGDRAPPSPPAETDPAPVR